MTTTEQTLNHIADSIRRTGNDPRDQIFGYITTGDVTYITRQGNARQLIETVDQDYIKAFLKELRKDK